MPPHQGQPQDKHGRRVGWRADQGSPRGTWRPTGEHRTEANQNGPGASHRGRPFRATTRESAWPTSKIPQAGS
jgi:hypothetical protein